MTMIMMRMRTYFAIKDQNLIICSLNDQKFKTFISNHFLKKLLQKSFNNANKLDRIINSKVLHEMISSNHKKESISLLPKAFKYKIEILSDFIDQNKVVEVRIVLS